MELDLDPWVLRSFRADDLESLVRYANNSKVSENLRIYARVFETNGASARVLEKAGFSLEGVMRQSVIKRGNVLDQSIYAILRSDVGPDAAG